MNLEGKIDNKTILLKSELRQHLAKGVKPIITGIGSYEDFGFTKPLEKPGEKPEAINITDVEKSLGLINLKNLDQDAGTYDGEEGALSNGPATYVISSIDESNKFSENFSRCLGLVIVGVDKITGKNISCLGHFDPIKMEAEGGALRMDLEQRLMEMKVKCKENTVDAVIMGGRYYNDYEIDFHQMEQLYDDSIKLLGGEVEEMFGFKPQVINGPKTYKGQDSIFVDNENRRAYLMRPKVSQVTGDFPYDEMDAKSKALADDFIQIKPNSQKK
ncbi:MAG: hypothetical protein WC847_02665 [Candidatus Paceibacterota bacterium]|jgi:hypothetical protein